MTSTIIVKDSLSILEIWCASQDLKCYNTHSIQLSWLDFENIYALSGGSCTRLVVLNCHFVRRWAYILNDMECVKFRAVILICIEISERTKKSVNVQRSLHDFVLSNKKL